MLDGAMLVWFVLTGASLLIVVWDSLANGVTSWVQRAAWILVTFYTGPVGLVLYLLACRRPFVGGHDRFTAMTWKQALNSEMHCLAGDATGIMIAAAIVPAFGLANGWDSIIEYLAGFVSGLFIFQALMMLPMYGGHYMTAVRKTFFAETVSMNLVMAGMIPTMLILGEVWPESDSPLNAAFWFRMGLATIVGGVLAYPVNHWLVANHLKHGCMTLPGADGPAPGLGLTSPEGPVTAMAGMGHGAGATSPSAMHAGHAHTAPGGHDHAMHGGHGGGARMHGTAGDTPREGGKAEPSMEMNSLSRPKATLIVLATFAILIAAVVATAQVVPVRF